MASFFSEWYGNISNFLLSTRNRIQTRSPCSNTLQNVLPLNRNTPVVTELMMLVCFFSVLSSNGYSAEKIPADPNRTPTLVKLHTITPSSTIHEYGVSNISGVDDFPALFMVSFLLVKSSLILSLDLFGMTVVANTWIRTHHVQKKPHWYWVYSVTRLWQVINLWKISA